jgi:peptidoglycan hydrolase-like protein with peptidoglycan-binding domain
MFTTSTVRWGSQGASVKLIQTLLKGLGYTNADGSALKIDGDAGSNTVHAITQYQKSHNLTVDGIAGAKTWAALIGL